MFERERCVSNITSSNNLLLNLYFEIFTFRLCKDQFRFRSNTGMDPGPRSPNNEFVECGKKS